MIKKSGERGYALKFHSLVKSALGLGVPDGLATNVQAAGVSRASTFIAEAVTKEAAVRAVATIEEKLKSIAEKLCFSFY